MYPTVEIIRLEEDFEYGTFGILKINKAVFCVTLEPKDEENQPFISSIPAQQYICRRIVSPKWGETFEVTNVPLRAYVLFHPGNIQDNTEGCIILAQYFGKLMGDRAVLNSGKTFQAFMEVMKGYDDFHLTIKEVY